MNDPVSDFTLEQYLLNELPAGRLQELAKRLEADPGLRQRLEALRDSNRELLARYPAAGQAAAIRARVRPAAPAWRRPVFVCAAAALLAVPLWLAVRPEGVRTKGAEQALYLYRKTPQGVERLANGASARAGDLLRTAYFAAAPGYGVILSLDGNGQVTVHFPASNAPAKIESGAKVALDRAYELDDAPGFERFWFLYSRAPLAPEAAAAAAERLAADPPNARTAPLALPPDVRQTSVTLLKEAR